MDNKIKEDLKKKRSQILEIRDLRNKINNLLYDMNLKAKKIEDQRMNLKTKNEETMLIILENIVEDSMNFIKSYIKESKTLIEKMFEFVKERLYEDEYGLLD